MNSSGNIIRLLDYKLKNFVKNNLNCSINDVIKNIKQKYNTVFSKQIATLKNTPRIAILSFKYSTRKFLVKKTKYIYIGIKKQNNIFQFNYENTLDKINNLLKTPSRRTPTSSISASNINISLRTPSNTTPKSSRSAIYISNKPRTVSNSSSKSKSSKIPKRKIDYTKYFLSHKMVEKDKLIFIEKSDDSVKSIVKTLLDNTIYISFELFYKYLLINVKALLIKHKDIKCIYFFINKYLVDKSNYWLSKLIEEIINRIDSNIEIKFINSLADLNTDDVILFIDDCIYSGIQMSGILNTAIRTKQRNVILQIYLFVSFITTNGLQYIKKNNRNINILLCDKVYYITKSINDLLTIEEIKRISTMYDKFADFNNKYLIYFDHKLADVASTITLFYSGLIPNKHNKKLLKEIPKYFNYNKDDISLIAQLEYHNFIENCNGINNFDRYEPKCPKAPYKNNEDYKKYVQHINKNRSFTSV